MAGVRKEGVKVHVEDGNILEISGERTEEEEEDKSDTWHQWRGGAADSQGGSGCWKTRTLMASSVAREWSLTVMVPKKETGQERAAMLDI